MSPNGKGIYVGASTGAFMNSAQAVNSTNFIAYHIIIETEWLNRHTALLNKRPTTNYS